MQKISIIIISQIIFFVLLCLLALFYVSNQIFIAKDNFPVNTTFEILDKETGEQIFTNLQQNGYIKSVFWAKVTSKLLGKSKFYRGEYNFQTPMSTYEILRQIGSRPISLAVLIPEGFTKKQIADRLAKYIVHFDRTDFLEKSQEGYLFPDTYYFFSFSTNDEIIKEFTDKFNQNMLENFGKMPSKQQIIIASMLEREAKDPEDMKIISGIIQNRLKIGMALQIDSTVMYGKGIWKDRVLYADLKNESDYNTYLNPGLPVGPISNPGLNAISAAMSPAKSNYLYYLTGKDGKMYYAKTSDEHVKNIQKYLR